MTTQHPRPEINFLISSPYGDLQVGEDKWLLPLEGDPAGTTYETYFNTIRDFVLREGKSPYLQALSKKLDTEVRLELIREIIVRAEKHGAFNHPASIEAILDRDRAKLCLDVATHEQGRKWLKLEYSVLQHLFQTFDLPYLPRPYHLEEMDDFSLLLEDWFQGFHEFHLTLDTQGIPRLKLWDFENGCKLLSEEQSFEIYRQASRILTLYYDYENASQIHPWNHASGDFVVRVQEAQTSGDDIEVKLTTARGYGPRISLDDSYATSYLIGLFHFFMDMTLKMRLDKEDGTGDILWGGDHCLRATTQGFFDGLQKKQELGHSICSTQYFLELIKIFKEGELTTSLDSIMDAYSEEEFQAVKTNLEDHVAKLYSTLQNFSL